jgi:hypothetical protein
VRLHTRSGEHLMRQSLRNLEQRLEQARFVRVHRSEIVNVDAVVRLKPWTYGDGILVLADGSTVVTLPYLSAGVPHALAATEVMVGEMPRGRQTGAPGHRRGQHAPEQHGG